MRVLVVEDDAALLVVANSTADADQPPAVEPCPGHPHVGLTIVQAVLEAHAGTIEWRCTATAVRAVVRLPALPRSPVAHDDSVRLGGQTPGRVRHTT